MRRMLALLVCVGFVPIARADPIVFSDGFEAPTINPFWTQQQQSGTISLVSSPVFSGNQAVRFTSFNSGVNKNINLIHTFATPVYGRASVRVFDTGADVFSSNYLALQLTRHTGTYDQKLIVGYDYDLGPSNGGNYYVGPGDINSGVDRTQGWHEFVIDTTPDSTKFYIDGVLVRSEAAGFAFDHLYLTMFGPSWRPAWTGYFDDFSFTEYREATATPEPVSAVVFGAVLLGVGAVGVFRRRR
jgi:hypothetical protein